jgi:hypothetical protein
VTTYNIVVSGCESNTEGKVDLQCQNDTHLLTHSIYNPFPPLSRSPFQVGNGLAAALELLFASCLMGKVFRLG